MTDKNPELEELIPADLLQRSGSNAPRPPGHDAILDLLAAEPAEVPSAPSPGDVLMSAEPPPIFRPGNTGIMSPDPTFPGVAPPNIPGPLGNPPQANAQTLGSDNPPPMVSPSVPGTDQSPTAPLSSLPTLDPALLSTLPFLPPPSESIPPTAVHFAASNAPPSHQSVPNSIRDILPLLPDAAPDSSIDDAAPWRQLPGAAGEPSQPAATAASGSTGNGKFADVATRPLPEITVSLGEGHRMANRVLATKDHKIEALARELCKNEIHRSFSLLRADMRANFR